MNPFLSTRRVFLQSALSLAAYSKQSKPWNIVFILADDLGWSDLPAYGGDFAETPNIDRLAASGLRLTQAYSASPVCSPTRASILTGKAPARLGMTTWHESAANPGAIAV